MPGEDDGDAELFRELVGDVQPLLHDSRVRQQKKAQQTPGLKARRKAATQVAQNTDDGLASVDYVDMLDPHAILAFKRPGVQHGVFKNLRLGKYSVETRIDLHRLTVEQSRKRLVGFVRDCSAHGVRCALITHGKGQGRERPALLKSCVNHWLQQVPEVLAFHSAQPNHGGSGATYVLFKKGEKDKDRNRERFGSRGAS